MVLLCVTISACGTRWEDRAVTGGMMGTGAGLAAGALIGAPLSGAVAGMALGGVAGGLTKPEYLYFGEPIWYDNGYYAGAEPPPPNADYVRNPTYNFLADNPASVRSRTRTARPDAPTAAIRAPATVGVAPTTHSAVPGAAAPLPTSTPPSNTPLMAAPVSTPGYAMAPLPPPMQPYAGGYYYPYGYPPYPVYYYPTTAQPNMPPQGAYGYAPQAIPHAMHVAPSYGAPPIYYAPPAPSGKRMQPHPSMSPREQATTP